MEQKSKRVCLRLPAALVDRMDYIARNSDAPNVKNRSSAFRAAAEAWAPAQEERFRKLGLTPEKTR